MILCANRFAFRRSARDGNDGSDPESRRMSLGAEGVERGRCGFS